MNCEQFNSRDNFQRGDDNKFQECMIGWYLSNVICANAVIFYAIYAIQKDSIVIKGKAYLLKEESLDIY